MSINASTDLRSRRTRKWLGDALLSLMQEKPFRAIQITEITDRAEVSRPAFYLHYRSKEELLFSYVDAGFEEFHTQFSQEVAAGNIDLQKFFVLLFQCLFLFVFFHSRKICIHQHQMFFCIL